MFSNKQQEMEYPWLSSQVDSFSPSFLYPLDDSKSFNINPHNHMSLSHSNGTNSNSNSNNVQAVDEEEEERKTILEKKLSHNARERDRRRKLNALFSSLSALLPPFGQKRKLSIPRTVSRVLKYIPEQRQELQRLSRRKEELLKRKTMSSNHYHHHQEEMRNKTIMDSISQQISANWLSDTEIALQIAATSKRPSISEMMLRLEENGFNVISVSSSVSSTERIFYTIHLEKRGDCRMRLEELNGILFGLTRY